MAYEIKILGQMIMDHAWDVVADTTHKQTITFTAEVDEDSRPYVRFETKHYGSLEIRNYVSEVIS